MEELILIRITGEDRPGLTASIMEILARYDVDIQDIGQADIHSTLSLGILIRVDENNSGRVMKDLLFKASEMSVNIRFYPITMEEYANWVNRQGKNRYILTVLGRKLKATQIEAISRLIADQELNIDSIVRLSGRASIQNPMKRTRACIQFSVRGTPKDKEVLHAELMRMSREMEIDCSFQTDNMYRRMRRLICFDMDSTLIQTEVIDELARKHGVYEKVAAITESAMRGEIDFKESFTERCKLLKGLDVSVMRDIAENLPFTEGVDLNRIVQILSNFISNAGKFTKEGKVTLGWQYLQSSNKVEMYVEDTGIGLTDEDIEKIFTRFYKKDEFIQGTGLGLPICQVIANRLGCTIKVKSEIGKGSRFSVFFQTV